MTSGRAAGGAAGAAAAGQVHTEDVTEMGTRRAYLADVRGNDQYLRATWHPETGVVVLSHWVGEICVASTPIGVAELSTLIELLVSALQDRADHPVVTPAPAPPSRWPPSLLEGIRRRLQPKLAEIITLRHPHAGGAEAHDGEVGEGQR